MTAARRLVGFSLIIAVMACPIVAIGLDSPALVVALCATPVLVAVHRAVQRRGGWRLFGPHVYFDLKRTARKGRTIAVRTLFLVVLAGGIYYAYSVGSDLQPRSPNPAVTRERLAQFNRSCIYAWFVMQNIAIVVLAPAYVGGAIAEERENRTLDLLFTSALHDREIVLGKLAARLVHLGGLSIAGLPIFSMMLVWGGVDMPLILGNWVNSMLLLVTVSSISLAISTLPISPTRCIVTSFLGIIMLGGCCFAVTQSFPLGIPYDLIAGSPGPWVVVGGCYAVLTVVFVSLAMLALRQSDQPPVEVQLGMGAKELDASPLSRLPPVTDDALLWKERYTGGWIRMHSAEVFVAVAYVLVPMLMPLLVWITSETQEVSLLESIRLGLRVPLSLILAAFLAFSVCSVAFGSAGCVVRERQARTLDLLVQLPVDRVEILRAKWLGVLSRRWPWLAMLFVDLFIGSLLGAFHPGVAGLTLLMIVAAIVCICSVGILISVIVPTQLQANLAMGALLVFAGVVVALTTHFDFLRLTFTFRRFREPESLDFWHTIAALHIVAGLFTVAGLSWGGATRLFERLGRR